VPNVNAQTVYSGDNNGDKNVTVANTAIAVNSWVYYVGGATTSTRFHVTIEYTK